MQNVKIHLRRKRRLPLRLLYPIFVLALAATTTFQLWKAMPACESYNFGQYGTVGFIPFWSQFQLYKLNQDLYSPEQIAHVQQLVYLGAKTVFAKHAGPKSELIARP